ncbi:MAG: hypothetical protein IPK76_09850 [Lewinellaceae bacterium]|nr:hypothetical protein [Lewinellaceae bacterium]
MELLSASAAALAMQRYGQNERSLFSFLEGTEHTGIKGNYDRRTNPFYNLANLHDNLIFNYYSFINSKYNPDFSAWVSIKGALEKRKTKWKKHLLGDCPRLIKAVGLLNIFASKGSNLDGDFLLQYAEVCLGIENPNPPLQALTDRKILFYRNYQKRFISRERTWILNRSYYGQGTKLGKSKMW